MEKKNTIKYLSGEFTVGQIFNSKENLQHIVKMYFIISHQEYVVVSLAKKLLVLRCKNAEHTQCPRRIRTIVVKGTSLFEIKKYSSQHICQSLHETRSSSVRFEHDSCSYKGDDKGTIQNFSGCHSSKYSRKIWVSNLIC